MTRLQQFNDYMQSSVAFMTLPAFERQAHTRILTSAARYLGIRLEDIDGRSQSTTAATGHHRRERHHTGLPHH